MNLISNMNKSILNIVILFGLTGLLPAQPETLDNFIDFESAEGSGDFILGESQNSVRFINFNLQSVGNPNLYHSGSKAVMLVPGAVEGKIIFERGVNILQFYAAETNSAGRIELRDRNAFQLQANGVVEGLPTNISPGSNPPLQSFIAFGGDPNDLSDLNFTNGIFEIKVIDVSGQFALDDLGFTYVVGPPNNTVFEDFENVDTDQKFSNKANFVLGQSPVTASFSGGIAQPISVSQGFVAFNHTNPIKPIPIGAINDGAGAWVVSNDFTGTITFETPAAKVQFYAAVFVSGDGKIEVFDTEDNLLTSTTDIPQSISITSPVPFTFFDFNAEALGAPGGIGKITYTNGPEITTSGSFFEIALDDIGFTPIGAPSGGGEPSAPSITTQPASQEVQSGTAVVLSTAASGEDLTYLWYTGNSGDTANPVAGATSGTLTTGVLTVSTNFWVQITNAGGSANSETAVITVAAPSVPLVLDGTGDIAGENIQHPNGNIFDQILLTGETIQLQARPGQITRVSFMDETEDIVQVEFSGTGSFTVTLDPATFLPPAIPPRYNQAVEYVTGKPSVVIDGADANTFFSIFTVGSINAVNQALFPEGQVYDAQADVTLVEVVNSTGMGGMQLSNAAFSGSTGRVGVDARGVQIAVRLTVGDIDADGDAVPHLLFESGSFTVAAGNPGLRITGGDLLQTNGAAVVVAESGSTTTGFDTLITQNNFKSDNTPQPTLSIDATFANEDGDAIEVSVEELTIE